MSYILDALKKSERDRQRDAEPEMRSIHAGFGRHQQRRYSRIGIYAGALLLPIGIGTGLWLGSAESYQPSKPAVETAASEPVATTTVATNPDAAAAAQVPIDTQTPADPVEAGLAQYSATPAQQPAGTLLLEIWQLSEAEQRFLDKLQVSLHVYSPDATQRTVIINGLRAREGQPLGQDLTLQEITTDGVIVLFAGKRVHLATIDS